MKYIVIHDTGDPGATAQNEHDYFAGGDREASADYFVDSGGVIQIIDSPKDYSWHCGDGAGKYGVTNANSVGVELCIDKTGVTTPETWRNGVELAQYLMDLYGVDIDHVVRHYDASRKVCPGSMSGNNWALWIKFKADVAAAAVVTPQPDKGDDEMIYNYIDANMPDWAHATIQKLVDKGFLKGDETGALGLNDTMLKIFVVNDRAGVYGG